MAFSISVINAMRIVAGFKRCYEPHCLIHVSFVWPLVWHEVRCITVLMKSGRKHRATTAPVSPLLASLFSCRDANHWPVKENARLQGACLFTQYKPINAGHVLAMEHHVVPHTRVCVCVWEVLIYQSLDLSLSF